MPHLRRYSPGLGESLLLNIIRYYYVHPKPLHVICTSVWFFFQLTLLYFQLRDVNIIISPNEVFGDKYIMVLASPPRPEVNTEVKYLKLHTKKCQWLDEHSNCIR